MRVKFITLSMSALLILLLTMLVGMNVMNYASAVEETDEILDLLSHNKGRFPNPEGNKGDKLPLHMPRLLVVGSDEKALVVGLNYLLAHRAVKEDYGNIRRLCLVYNGFGRIVGPRVNYIDDKKP